MAWNLQQLVEELNDYDSEDIIVARNGAIDVIGEDGEKRATILVGEND